MHIIGDDIADEIQEYLSTFECEQKLLIIIIIIFIQCAVRDVPKDA